ncbi:MAG: hypothetical protein HY858_00700 [Candidatus Solibacter usitatus]|nr:hypothetical protein [Candidatus Solibacter usitatus]
MIRLTKAQQSRINGAKSKGPITAAGKARSSMNALKHSLYSASPIRLTDDDRDTFVAHHQAFIQQFQPATPVEAQIVANIADAFWCLSRYAEVPAQLESLEIERARRSFELQVPGAPAALHHANAFKTLADRSRAIPTAARLIALWQRVINDNLRILQQLRHFPLPDSPTNLHFDLDITPQIEDDGTTLRSLLNQALDPQETNLAEPGANPTEPAP